MPARESKGSSHRGRKDSKTSASSKRGGGAAEPEPEQRVLTEKQLKKQERGRSGKVKQQALALQKKSQKEGGKAFNKTQRAKGLKFVDGNWTRDGKGSGRFSPRLAALAGGGGSGGDDGDAGGIRTDTKQVDAQGRITTRTDIVVKPATRKQLDEAARGKVFGTKMRAMTSGPLKKLLQKLEEKQGCSLASFTRQWAARPQQDEDPSRTKPQQAPHWKCTCGDKKHAGESFACTCTTEKLLIQDALQEAERQPLIPAGCSKTYVQSVLRELYETLPKDYAAVKDVVTELKEQAVLSVEATVKARAQAKGNRSGSKLLEASHLRLCGLEHVNGQNMVAYRSAIGDYLVGHDGLLPSGGGGAAGPAAVLCRVLEPVTTTYPGTGSGAWSGSTHGKLRALGTVEKKSSAKRAAGGKGPTPASSANAHNKTQGKKKLKELKKKLDELKEKASAADVGAAKDKKQAAREAKQVEKQIERLEAAIGGSRANHGQNKARRTIAKKTTARTAKGTKKTKGSYAPRAKGTKKNNSKKR